MANLWFAFAAELDSLGEREFAGGIDRVSLPPHVTLPGVAAAFASAAGFFLAAESPADFGPAGAGIDIGNAAIASTNAAVFFHLAKVVGEDFRTQARGHGVVQRDSFVKAAIGNQIKQRSESLFLHNFV